METTNSSQPGRQSASSPPLGHLSLNSNNPFRNRGASPASLDASAFTPPTSTSPFDDPKPQRPVSRNPFLDHTTASSHTQQQSSSSATAARDMPANRQIQPQTADDFFQSLSLEERSTLSNNATSSGSQRRPAESKRPENTPLMIGISKHRPTHSQEEALRAKRQGFSDRRGGPPASPQRRPQRRPRRNSESSVLDFDAQPLTAEEKKLIEAHRQRDRLRRERAAKPEKGESGDPRDGKDRAESRDKRSGREEKDTRDGKQRSKSGRPSRRMDIIDQLDATSIYGTGLFHHDGPFDALNPSRNKARSRRAPMEAFPKDSLNNALGGFGPVNNQPDHATFMGRGNVEAFQDYATGGSTNKNRNGFAYTKNEPIFDPSSRGDVIHGDESYGLGTSTFLEGTPAARSAIAKHAAEQSSTTTDGGLQRKKSLAQRIRHMNKGPRDFSGGSGRGMSPNDLGNSRSPDGVASAGIARDGDNPFFAEYGKGEEVLTVQRRDGALSPDSPPARRGSHNALERRATTDAAMGSGEASTKPSGLLGRMKSLKGGKRAPRVSDAQNNPPVNPGNDV